MKLIKNSDFYSVKLRGYVTNLHLQVLDVLYQPFLGVAATTLYRFFFATSELRKGDPLTISLIKEHLGFTNEQITSAISKLEAISLCATYYVKRKEFNEYIIELFAPKDPAQFSVDPVFSHLFFEALSPKVAQDLLSLFALEKETVNGENISATFGEVFTTTTGNLDFNNGRSAELTNVIGDIKFTFDEGLFYNILTKERKILPTAISKEEMAVLRQIGGLFQLTEQALAGFVGDYYESSKPLGHRVDIEKIKLHLQEIVKYDHISKPMRRKLQKLTGEGEKIKEINLMETTGPYDYLVIKNDGTKVAPADGRILNDLAIEYGLVPPVINALIYYTLRENDSKLTRSFIEKIASHLARTKVTSALDALDVLEKQPVPKTSKSKEKKPKVEREVVDDSQDGIWEELKKIHG